MSESNGASADDPEKLAPAPYSAEGYKVRDAKLSTLWIRPEGTGWAWRVDEATLGELIVSALAGGEHKLFAHEFLDAIAEELEVISEACELNSALHSVLWRLAERCRAAGEFNDRITRANNGPSEATAAAVASIVAPPYVYSVDRRVKELETENAELRARLAEKEAAPETTALVTPVARTKGKPKTAAR